MEKAADRSVSYEQLRNIYLYLEYIVLFFGMPFLVYLNPHTTMKIPLLIGATVVVFLILYFDKNFDRKEFTRVGNIKKYLPRILLRSVIVFAFMTGLSFLVIPEKAFGFVKTIPYLWLFVMFAYPIFSAYPQEVLFRTFQFHRYRHIFKNDTTKFVLSTISFAFLHIIYHNNYAVPLTLVAGIIFTRTYLKNKSLVAVAIEHAIYGNIVFTVGFGEYFYRVGMP